MSTAADVAILAATQGVCTHEHFCWEQPMPQGNDLRGLFSPTAGEVWAVGARGTVLHYHKSAWTGVPSGTAATLSAVWAAGNRDVWAVGAAGTVLRHEEAWDGTLTDVWRAIPGAGAADLEAVWGSGPNDVYIAGQHGTLLHWDGGALQPISTGVAVDLHALWGRSPRDIYAAGALGTLLHYDGVWQKVKTGTTAVASDLNALWGQADEVYVGGAGGVIFPVRGDQAGPVIQVGGTERMDVLALSGDTGGVLYAAVAGGGVWRRDSLGWTQHQSRDEMHALVAGGGLALAVGSSGSMFQIADGQMKSLARGLGTPGLRAAWGTDQGELWAVGQDGGALVLRPGAAAWESVQIPGATTLNAIWGASASDVWAVGVGIWHYDGVAWQQSGSGAPGGVFYGVWGSSASDVWAVGGSGVLWHYNGLGWQTMSLPAGVLGNESLLAVHGSGPQDVVFVGEGTILTYHNKHWSRIPLPADATGAKLESVWAGEPGQAVIVGTAGVVLRQRDGAFYRVPQADFDGDWYAIGGGAAADLWAVGSAGALLHLEGPSSTWVAAATEATLRGVFAPPRGATRLFGDRGAVLRHR